MKNKKLYNNEICNNNSPLNNIFKIKFSMAREKKKKTLPTVKISSNQNLKKKKKKL